MSTLALAATGTVSAVLGMAAMYVPARLARYDARQYNALADDKLSECEARDAAFEETRNLPWHYAVESALEPEPVDEDAVNGEVLHVEHATGELPALPAHANTEESAPDRAGMWRVLLGLANDLVDRAHDWLPNLLRQWRERNDVGTGETAVALDRFERFRIDDSPRGRCQPRTDAEIRAELAELTGGPVPDPDAEVMVELEAWVAANPPTNPPYKPWHLNDRTAQYEVVRPGRHRKPDPDMPAINVPAQRTGDEA